MKFALILSVCLALFSVGQKTETTFIVKGTIYDESNLALIGANVHEKGTNNGTISDIDGSFQLEVGSEKSILVISYTGYTTQEVKAEKTSMTIHLTMSQLLDEVVIVGFKSESPPRSNIAAHSSGISNAKLGKRNKTNRIENEAMSYSYTGNLPTVYQNDFDEDKNYSKPPENGFVNPDSEPYSTFSLDVDKASYSNIRRFIDNGQLPPVDAVRVEEMINYFEYKYQEPRDKHPLNIQSVYTECPWNQQHKLLHVAVKAKEINYEDLPNSNLVFLIDVSGSMSDFNKLPLVKSSFKMLLNKLRPHDKVAIVTYAGRSAVVLEPTEAIEKKTILNAIDNLNSGGGTAGAEGIKTAYELAELHFMEKGNNRVILATDGDFNIGISSSKELEQMIEKKRNKGIYLSVLGYGMGNYMDDKMQTLADKGNGNHAYIDNIQEARKVLISEFGGTLYTVAKDVKIQIEFNPAYVQSYRLVGYENRMLNKEDFNNDRKDAGEVGAGHCVTAIYEIIPVGSSSRFGPKVDALKYQENRQKISGKENGELAHIKCRYKLPREESSIKFENIVKHDLISEKLLDDDIRFAIAVAEFGLILSESQYLESSDLTACINRAQKSKSDDKEGYRSEFVRLVKTVNDLK